MSERIITVTAAADDLALLSLEELRVAVGATDSSLDARLQLLGRVAAADIMTECAIASDGIHPPTLLSETIEETFRLHSCQEKLVLARRFVTEISSVVEDGILLDPGDYQLQAEAGLLARLLSDYPGSWRCSKVIVTYVAGFAAAPDDLKGVCADEVRGRYYGAARDPLVKSETNEVPGVLTERRDYWVGGIPQSGAAGPVTEASSGKLKRFRNAGVV